LLIKRRFPEKRTVAGYFPPDQNWSRSPVLTSIVPGTGVAGTQTFLAVFTWHNSQNIGTLFLLIIMIISGINIH